MKYWDNFWQRKLTLNVQISWYLTTLWHFSFTDIKITFSNVWLLCKNEACVKCGRHKRHNLNLVTPSTAERRYGLSNQPSLGGVSSRITVTFLDKLHFPPTFFHMMIFSTMLGQTVFLKWHTRTCLTLFFYNSLSWGSFSGFILHLWVTIFTQYSSVWISRPWTCSSLDHGCKFFPFRLHC